jgi:hypothetical protein
VIVNSVLVDNVPEPGGAHLIHERHTDHTGAHYARFYRAAAGDDVQANLAAYATALLTALAEMEAERVLND